MKIEKIRISDLKPYKNNAKIHTPEQVEQIKKSIEDFGFNDPIAVDENNMIIEGHGRLLAVQALGWAEVDCIRLDGMTDEQKRAYIHIHNQLTMNTGFDLDILEAELKSIEGIDMDFFGFDMDFELDADFDFDGEDDIDGEDDFEAEIPEEPRARPGDIYQLGRHRLMCGDSTDKETVELLMNGNKADMVFTDPPYNIAYQGVSDKRTIQNDKMSDDAFVDFLENALMPCETMYVCCSWQYAHLFRQALENIGQKIKAMIVWDKVNPAQHLDKYFKQHEIIWYCGAFGGEKTLRGDVWQCKRQRNTVHPTMKPIELIAMALLDQPKKKIVYDGFGGSGSTLIACEKLGRTCYMMELDPKYVDVIIDRWEKYTGEKAVLLDGT